MSIERKFEGIWIPKEIWLSEELSLQEKIFMVEIKSLDNEHGCFAGNSYFSEFFKLSKGRVSQIISGLEQKGIINISYIYKDNSKEIDKRIIRINHENYLKMFGVDGIKYSNEGISDIKRGIKDSKQGCLENCNDNNTIINNTNNNINNNISDNPISKDIVKPTKKSSNTSNQLIQPVNKKTQKAKDIGTMKSMIYAFTENEDIQNKLLEYFSIRVKKGLQPLQWKIILDDLRDFTGGYSDVAIDKINNAIAGGYMQIIASWEKNKKAPHKQANFDNTAGRPTNAVVYMSEQEKREFESNLATDENGNLLTF